MSDCSPRAVAQAGQPILGRGAHGRHAHPRVGHRQRGRPRVLSCRTAHWRTRAARGCAARSGWSPSSPRQVPPVTAAGDGRPRRVRPHGLDRNRVELPPRRGGRAAVAGRAEAAAVERVMARRRSRRHSLCGTRTRAPRVCTDTGDNTDTDRQVATDTAPGTKYVLAPPLSSRPRRAGEWVRWPGSGDGCLTRGVMALSPAEEGVCCCCGRDARVRAWVVTGVRGDLQAGRCMDSVRALMDA